MDSDLCRDGLRLEKVLHKTHPLYAECQRMWEENRRLKQEISTMGVFIRAFDQIRLNLDPAWRKKAKKYMKENSYFKKVFVKNFNLGAVKKIIKETTCHV